MSSDGLFSALARRLESSDDPSTFVMADLLDLPDAERTVMRHLMRRAAPTPVSELAHQLFGTVADVDGVVQRLAERGAVSVTDDTVSVATIARRTTPGGIWDRLSDL